MPSEPRAVHLRLLGATSLHDANGCEVPGVLAQPSRTALLAYLAMAAPGEFLHRSSLVRVFWPDGDEAHARGALRQGLRFLRRALGPDLLVARGQDEVRLADGVCRCDAVEFEAAVRACDAPRALALYRGDLMDGFAIRDAPEFEEWLERERARLARAFAAALERAAHDDAARGDHALAAERWRALVLRAPGSSRAVLGLMTALVALGERADSLAEAERHRALLAREFGTTPDSAIVALTERLRRSDG